MQRVFFLLVALVTAACAAGSVSDYRPGGGSQPAATATAEPTPIPSPTDAPAAAPQITGEVSQAAPTTRDDRETREFWTAVLVVVVGIPAAWLLILGVIPSLRHTVSRGGAK